MPVPSLPNCQITNWRYAACRLAAFWVSSSWKTRISFRCRRARCNTNVLVMTSISCKKYRNVCLMFCLMNTNSSSSFTFYGRGGGASGGWGFIIIIIIIILKHIHIISKKILTGIYFNLLAVEKCNAAFCSTSSLGTLASLCEHNPVQTFQLL